VSLVHKAFLYDLQMWWVNSWYLEVPFFIFMVHIEDENNARYTFYSTSLISVPPNWSTDPSQSHLFSRVLQQDQASGSTCHPASLSSCHLVIMLYCHLVILSSCHFVILSSFHRVILSSCLLSSCPLVLLSSGSLSIFQLANLSVVDLSACQFASLWASQLVSFSACASWSLRACFFGMKTSDSDKP